MNLLRSKDDNRSGLFLLMYIDRRHVVSIPEAVDCNIADTVELASGKGWNHIELSVDDRGLTITERVTDNGILYDVVVEGFLAGESNFNVQEKQRLRNLKLNGIAIDNSNTKRYLGDLESHMSFSFKEFKTFADPKTGRKGTKVTFFGTFTYEPYFYQGLINPASGDGSPLPPVGGFEELYNLILADRLRMTAIEAYNTTQDGRLVVLEENAGLQAEQIDALQEQIDGIQSDITDIHSDIAAINAKLTDGLKQCTITDSSFTPGRKVSMDFPFDENPNLTLEAESVPGRKWYLLFTSSAVPVIDFMGISDVVEGSTYTIYIVKGYADDLTIWLDPSITGDIAFRDLDNNGATISGYTFSGPTGSRFAIEITIRQGSGIVEYMSQQIGWFTRDDKTNLESVIASKQNALGFTPENVANKNASNGYPGLTAGKITLAQLQNIINDSSNSSSTETWSIDKQQSMFVKLVGATMSGDLLFSTNKGIDSVSGGTLNIGAANAAVINYGNATTVHNFLGQSIHEYQANAYITDKLITLNDGGAVSSGIGVGFEIEENSVITGYFKTNAGRNGYSMKAPAWASDLTIISTPTSARTWTVPDISDTFVGVTATQTLTNKTLTSPIFDNFSISGVGGSGYGEFIAQSSNPTTPSSTGFRLFASSVGSLSWVRNNGSDTFVRTFASTLTANRTYTLANASGTFAFGTGATGQIGFWSDTNTLNSSSTFTFSSSVNASGGSAVASILSPTLTATANNDSLVAFRIQPTRVPGSFTGVLSIDLQASFIAPNANNTGSLGNSSFAYSSIFVSTIFGGAGQNVRIQTGSKIDFGIGNTTYASVISSTGNFMIQNGGTYTDSGDRFQVVGSSLFSSGVSTFLINSIASGSSSNAILISNTSAATSGVQQNSPSLILQNNAWGTTAPGSQPMQWRIESRGVSNTIGSSNLVFSFNRNSAGFVDFLTINPNSSLVSINGLSATTITGSTFSSSFNASSANIFSFNGGVGLGSTTRNIFQDIQALSGTGTATVRSFASIFGSTSISGGNIFSFYSDLSNVSGASAKWAFYNNDTNAPSYFAGILNLNTVAAHAAINFGSGANVSSPAHGDLWFDGSDVKIRVSGVTYTLNKS